MRNLARFALSISATGLLLAGCGASPPPIGGSIGGVLPQASAGSHASRHGSWMRSDAINDDLAYVATDGVVFVYSYPEGVLVGALQGFDIPGGLCVDAKEDVWVPDGAQQKLTEFAHGNPYSIGTLNDSGYYPNDCAIDQSTGNLAVINSGANDLGYGNVAVYQNAQGSPTYYSDPTIAYYRYGSYDQSGNLYVDGLAAGSPPTFRLAVLPKGSSAFTDIMVNVPVRKESAPGLFWDGKYLALSNGGKKVYRLSISGSVAKRVNTAGVKETEGLAGGIWVQGNRIIGNGDSSANIWPYPKGGAPVRELPVYDYAYGAAVSTGTSTTAYKTVYEFLGGQYGPDGVNPVGGVVSMNGLIYGTTAAGGTTTWGTVYGVTPSGTESMLYNFHGVGDASTPYAGLTVLNGSLYGTAIRGGANNDGAVFAITPSGAEHIVHSFSYANDGKAPYGGLVVVKGTLYGTALLGGKGYGTVFALTPDGKEKTLYKFKGGKTDGEYPQANLTYADGFLYGTTYQGGSANDGTAFKMSLKGQEKFVYSFQGGSDGEYPESNLTELKSVLYGTTFKGGNGYGTVYSLTESGRESVVYAFKGKLDGSAPIGSLAAVNGALYGTTSRSGFHILFGTLFRLTTAGQLTVLHSFSDIPDGANPESPLTLINGHLYGTALEGGSDTGCPGYGCGTVYRFKP